MSTQDQLEKTLRQIHILLSKGEAFNHSDDKVVISRREMIALLNDLNQHIYQMMDDYELTKQSRDKAEREFKRRGEKLMKNAEQKAEDVYAASVLYTNEALGHIQRIIDGANVSMKDILLTMSDEIEKQKDTVKGNQLELESQLHDMADTKKYLQMIDNRNRELEKEQLQTRQVMHKKEPRTPFPKPEIKINESYFKQNNIPLEEEKKAKDEITEKVIKESPQIKVNLNAKYFQWKEKEKPHTDENQIDLNKEDLS